MTKSVAIVKKSLHGYGGGAELFIACANEYHRRGFTVSMYVCEASNVGQFNLINFDVNIIANLKQNSSFYQRTYNNLSFLFSPITFLIVAFKIMKNSNYSIVHIHESLGPLLAFYLKVLLGVKTRVVWTQNDFLIASPYTHGIRKSLRKIFGGIYQKSENYMSKWLDLTCVLDAKSKDTAQKNLNSIILENPVALLGDLTEFEQFIEVPNNYVLCNASYSEHRLFDTVIDAVSIYNQKYEAQTISIVIVGDGNGRVDIVTKLEARASNKNVQLIQIPKLVSFAQLNYLFSSCSYFAFVGQNQTWGLAPFKALAFGKPTIVSDGCGAASALHGICNIVEAGNCMEISNCFSSPIAINMQSIEKLFDELSIESYIQRVLDSLEDLVG